MATPLSSKTFGTPQVTQFFEGPTPPLMGGGGGLTMSINILGFTILKLRTDLIDLLATGIINQPLCRLSY